MRIRHVSRKKIKRLALPSGQIIATRIGDEFDASEADGAWLLTLRARNCNCNSRPPKPHGNGVPVYALISSEV